MVSKKQTIKKSALAPTALVSGGAGFIGSHLVESLLANNARVIVLDNYKTGKDLHIKHLLSDPNFAFYNVDINAGIPPEIESVDYIIHLAGLEEYLYSKEFVNLDSLLTNSSGTKNLLDLAHRSNSKFLLASTIDVYQGQMSPVELTKYFGRSSFEENKFSLTEAKRFAEAIVWESFKKYDIDARIVRLPEVYGPRMNLEASGSLGGYMKSVIEGTDITVYGDGFDKEYYLYISDVVSGLVKSLFGPTTKGNIYSLIPESPISTLEIAYLVRKMADGEIGVQFKNRLGDVPRQVRIPDSFNLKDIDWKAKIEFNQGVRKTLEWFGYSINQNQFKPSKFIQQKIADNKQVMHAQPITTIPKVVETEKSFSIADQFQASPQLKEVVQAIGVTKPNRRITLPKLRFPKLSMPKINIFNNTSGFTLRIISVLAAAFCIFVIMPLASLSISVYGGINSLRKVESAVEKLDPTVVINESKKASASFKSATKSFSSIKWLFRVAQGKERTANYEKILYSLRYFSDGVSSVGAVGKPLQKLMLVLRPDNYQAFDQNLIDEVELNLSGAIRSVGLAKAELSGSNFETMPVKVKSGINTYQKLLASFSDSLDLATSLVSNLPNIVGANGEKNYIVWFQNSNELRPTGGFIGSYGILKLDNGKLKEIVIDDIYNPDGQIELRNIVASPPQPIIDYLKENKLFLRNSNWSPDFPKSTKEFDDLYFKVTGTKIDGYIAVDLYFVKSLLKVTGPIFLAAYNEEINADNVYERTQFHSDFNYQNGSDQKRSFLTILGSKLLEKLFSLSQDRFTSLMSEVSNSLEQKHLLVYFSNNPFNAFLKERGWDGSLPNVSDDYLYVVNSNLGGTKANYYVKNKISYEISSMTRDGLLRANLNLDYVHTGKDMSWPGGPYKDYLRVLTQEGSKLTGAKLIRDDGLEEDIFKNVVITKEGSYNSFELGFTLDPLKKIRIVLNYDLPQRLSMTKENPEYSLFWQKQPGTEDDQFGFVFFPPFGMLVDSFSSGLKLESNTIKSEGTIQTDSSYFVKLR